MKHFKTKTAMLYGTISGLFIVSSWFIAKAIAGEDGKHLVSEIIGYTIMVAALSTVFLGIKKVRDEQGFLSFKHGFLNGLGISLVASVVYTIGWVIYMPNFEPDFAEKYAKQQIEQIEATDISTTEKVAAIEKVNQSVAQYKKPGYMMLITFSEIFPVGLIVSLISTLILLRKPSHPS